MEASPPAASDGFTHGAHGRRRRRAARTDAPNCGRGRSARRRRAARARAQAGSPARAARAVVDSDASSCSLDSEIAADYVTNVLLSTSTTSDDALLSTLDAAAAPDADALRELVKYRAPQALQRVRDAEPRDELELGLDFQVARGRRRGRKQAHRASRHTQDLTSLYGEPVEGVGRDMLARMGWQAGQGLGVNQDGRTQPVEVRLQRSRRGLGSGGGAS